jgi:hypothetical protein
MGRSSYRTLLSLAIILLSIVLGSINMNNDNNSFLNAFGHTFSPNESASFLSFVDQIQVESELVQTNLANDSTSLAQEHAKRAGSLLTSNITTEIAEENQRVANELTRAINNLQDISLSPQQVGSVDQLVSDINSILGEAESTRIEQEDLENATIQALAFADLVNSILENYGNAYAVDFDMTNMSNMIMNGQGNSDKSMMTMSNMSTHSNGNTSDKEMDLMNMSSSSTMVGMDVGGAERSESGINSSSSPSVNLTGYQSALALAAKALEIFNTELKPMAPNNSSALLTNLENGLTQLNASIRNKASPMDIMMIVHTQIHPNTLQAFSLRSE